MADKTRIRGITIEIAGDTSKLGDSLRAVNKEISGAQKSLKDVSKLLKLDPGNTELLTQKQKYLTESIDATKRKLEELKGVSRDSVSADQWDAVQREIAATEQELERLEGEYRSFGSVGAQQVAAVGGKMQELGGKIEAAGKALAPVSAAAAGALAGGVAATKELSEGYDTIVKKTGAVGDQLDGLKSVADDVFGSMPVTMAEAGTAIGEVNTRFGVTGDELRDLSQNFIQFSKIADTDLNSSIGKVDRLMEQFGMDISETGPLLDMLAAKGQETGISVDTLMDSVQRNGASLKEMGLSIEESVNLLAEFEKNGVNADTALSGLKKSVTELAKGESEAAAAVTEAQEALSSQAEKAGAAQDAYNDALATYGATSKEAESAAAALAEEQGKLADAQAALDEAQRTAAESGGTLRDALAQSFDAIKNAASETEALSLASEIFGTRGAVEMAKGIREGRVSLEGLEDELKNYEGAVNSTYENTQHPWQEMQTSMNQVKLAGAELGESLLTTLAPIMEQVAEAVRSLSEWFRGLDDETKQTIVEVGLAVAALSPLLIIIGKVVGTIGTVLTVVPQITGAISSVIGFLTGGGGIVASIGAVVGAIGPFIAIAAAVVGAIAAVVLIVKNWDTVMDGIKGSIENFKQSWAALTEGAKNAGSDLAKVFKSMGDDAKAGFESMKSAAKEKFEALKNTITSIMDAAKQKVKEAVDKLKGFFNFEWKLPKIKLPHFKLTGTFSLNPPQVPKLSIDWYKKAYDDAYILSNPTIFGAQGGRLLGGGEGGGSEVVVGTDKLMGMIAQVSGGGDITIPVYIGQDLLDTVVVKAVNRANYRSGGR